MTRVAILNSRQSKTPAGNDPWVQATLAAVDHCVEQGWTILSSIGMNTWELVTWAAGRRHGILCLICPEDFTEKHKADVLRGFDLDGEKVEWESVTRVEGKSTAKNWWENRDHSIILHADSLLPISVRKGGRIDSLIADSPGKAVDTQFRVPSSSISHHERDTVTVSQMNPDLKIWPDGWLIHWTRACRGPWPGESHAGFYADLAASTDFYCRSALVTLRRILTESRIRASSWRVGAGVPVVGLTELSPAESLKLMRWRPRWSRWSFEPYGIAITREAADALGVKAVEYVDEQDWRKLSEIEKPLFHRKGRATDIWPAEREWRALGDVGLSSIPQDQVRVLVRRASEASELAGNWSYRAYFFEA